MIVLAADRLPFTFPEIPRPLRARVGRQIGHTLPRRALFLRHDHQLGSLRHHGLPPVKRAKLRRAEFQREGDMERVQ